MSGKLTLLAFVLALAGYASGAEAFSQKVMNTCGSAEDLDAAIKACTQLIDGKESRSTKVAAYFNRAWAYRTKGQPDLAIADDTRAIELDPKAYRAFADRGAAYHDKDEYDLAIADATRSIELNPKESVTYNNRGQAYRAKGDYDRAFADLNRAIELNPKNSHALYNRGTAHLDKTAYE